MAFAELYRLVIVINWINDNKKPDTVESY